jgi:hypothetical protein
MFSNKPIRIALAATVSEFLSIRCVEPVKRALPESLAGEGSDLLPVVMARFAEVMCAEAEPPGGLAAVAALVHDEIGSVLGAGSHTDLHTVLLAEAADIIDYAEKDWGKEEWNGGCPVSLMAPGEGVG